MISYEIIISTTEYRNDVSVRTDVSVWHVAINPEKQRN